jgi:hypothetical protein
LGERVFDVRIVDRLRFRLLEHEIASRVVEESSLSHSVFIMAATPGPDAVVAAGEAKAGNRGFR